LVQVTGDFEAQLVVTLCQAMLSTMTSGMGNSYDSLGNTSSDHEPEDLPNLLSSNAHIQRQRGQPKLFLSKTLFEKKFHTSAGGNISEHLVAPKGSVSGPAQAIALDGTTADTAAEKKGFVDGDRVEYYYKSPKSYGRWIPAIISDVRPNGCLKLLHDDGFVLKNEADPNSVRLAREQAKQGHDNQPKFDTSLGDCTLSMCSQAASGIKQENIEQSSSKALDSKEAHDEEMKFLKIAFFSHKQLRNTLSQNSLDQSLEVLHVLQSPVDQKKDEEMKCLDTFRTNLATKSIMHNYKSIEASVKACGIKQANNEQSSSEALGSKDAHDEQMKFRTNLATKSVMRNYKSIEASVASVKAWNMISN